MGANTWRLVRERHDGVADARYASGVQSPIGRLEPNAVREGNMESRYANTVLVLMQNGADKETALSAAKECGVEVWDTECATDLIGAPYFLALVDPGQIAGRDWSEFCEYLADASDTETRILLTQPRHHYADTLPKSNAVALADAEHASLKFLMLRLRAATERRHAVWERAERRIVRILWMVRELQGPEGLRLRHASREFGVTVRTIQRDLEVLMMAGYAVGDGAGRGTYVMDRQQMREDGRQA